MRYLWAALLALVVLAQSTIVSAQNVTVTAVVPTKVDLEESTLTITPTEILSDGAETAIATVTLIDESGEPLNSIVVKVTTNRGEIDTVKAYEGSTLSDDNIAQTDSNGVARFAIRSAVAGTATVSAVVDYSEDVLARTASLTVKSLPVITQVSVSVNIPGVGKIDIIKPQTPQITPEVEDDGGEIPTNRPIERQKIVETGVSIDIGFYQALVILLLILLLPTAIGLIVLLASKTNKLRKEISQYQNQEQAMLEKIYQLEGQIASNAATQAQMTKSLGESIAAEEVKIEQKIDDLNNLVAASTSQAPQPQVSDDQTVAQE